MPEELKDINDIPKEILEECGQLTKENSIQGCKKGSVKIVYTFAANLRKEKPMATGEVSFHDNSKCMYMNISTNKKLVKAIIKTKREENPDLKRIYEDKMKDLEHQEKELKVLEEHKKKEEDMKTKEAKLKEKEDQKMASFEYMMKRENMTTNQEAAQDDDFW
eukprot:TRINITY_DN650_c0_g3_i3.p2 TRINITY_DN650_c0_g3~~TRINITY_DN650_c0_g3_i3.p2  ORF type:complete len:163 (+),score=87.23 TRINITY_DN650_c0_g3_i3:273-761(+)